MDNTEVHWNLISLKSLQQGQKKVKYLTSGKKAQITIIGYGRATGQRLPPFIIFTIKHLNKFGTMDEISGFCYGVSNEGWVDLIFLAKGALPG